LQAGDDKKLLQVASRKKKLEERHGLDRNAAGHKFKVNFPLYCMLVPSLFLLPTVPLAAL
jgi:hypothetical protein